MNVEKSLKMATEIESALSSLTIKHCDSQKRTSVVVNFIETKNQYLDEDFERKRRAPHPKSQFRLHVLRLQNF